MRLTYHGLHDLNSWERAGILLPSYDPEKISAESQQHPAWVRFGIGSIFRSFLGGIADDLLSAGNVV